MALPANGQNVKLGKGSLLLDTLTNVGGLTGYDFMGNATALSLSADVSKAQLFSSTQRSAPLIAEDITRIAYNLTVTLSEFTLNNLKKFLLGSLNAKTQNIGSGVTVSKTGAEVVPGKYVDLGYRQISDLAVVRDGSDALVADVDYVLYSEFGIVKLNEGAAVQAGDDVDFTFDTPALIIDQVQIAKESSPRCRLLYLADDANQDGASARDRLEIWRVSVAPEGELQVIGDDYGNFQLAMGVLSDAANHPNDPFGTLDRVRVA